MANDSLDLFALSASMCKELDLNCSLGAHHTHHHQLQLTLPLPPPPPLVEENTLGFGIANSHNSLTCSNSSNQAECVSTTNSSSSIANDSLHVNFYDSLGSNQMFQADASTATAAAPGAVVVHAETKTTNNANDSSKKSRVKSYYCSKDKVDELRLRCELSGCERVFDNMDVFLRHIEAHLAQYFDEMSPDNDSPRYKCEWSSCESGEFDCESTFQRHVRFHAFHTKLKEIGASILANVNRRTTTATTGASAAADTNGQDKPVLKCNLDEQTRNIIPELPFKFACSWNYCQHRTDDPELFYRHIRDQHVATYPSKMTNAKCRWSECEQIIANRNRVGEHLRHHSQEKLVACPICGALFATCTKFIDHCSRSSQARNLCYQCSHCNKKFATNNLLKEHTRKHVNKFKCPVCDMTCITRNDLSKHMLYKHTTVKSLKCSLCEHRCKSHHDLQKHMELKHYERSEYECTECVFKSKDVNNIKRHMLKCHLSGEGSLIVNDGQQFSSSYMCHVCNKVYSQAATLSKHLRKRHNFESQSGHSKFRYKLEADGYYRLQTLRYESVELVEQLTSIAANVQHPQQQTEEAMIYSIDTDSDLATEQQQQSQTSSFSLDFSMTTTTTTNKEPSDNNEDDESRKNDPPSVDDNINAELIYELAEEPLIQIENQIGFKTSKARNVISTTTTTSIIEHQQEHQPVNGGNISSNSGVDFDLDAFLNSNFQLRTTTTTATNTSTTTPNTSVAAVHSSAIQNMSDDSNLMKCFFIEKLMNEPSGVNSSNAATAATTSSASIHFEY